MRVAFLTLILMAAIGCGHVHQGSSNKNALSSEHGFAKVDLALDAVNASLGHLAALPVGERAQDYVQAIKENIVVAREGEVEAKKACDNAIKQNDTSRQPFYHMLDWAVFLGGGALAIGIAVIALSVVNGRPIAAGVATATLGGSAVVVYLGIRSAAPLLPWAVGGMILLALVGFGYLVYERISTHIRLKKEQNATVELTRTVDVVRNELTPETDQRLFGRSGVVEAIQSQPTKALVAAAKTKIDGGDESTTTN